MKKISLKIIITILIIHGFVSTSFAQTDSATGKIYFMGSPKSQLLEYYPVFIDSKHLCNMYGKHYFVYNAQIGKHFLSMGEFRDKSNGIGIIVEEGKSYYIQFYLQNSNTIAAKRINADLANMILPSLKQDIGCVNKIANKGVKKKH